MTIDIKIGKLKIKSFEEVFKQKLQEEYTLSFESTFSMIEFLEVEQCPNEIDGCSREDTLFPNSAYRSGSIFAISEFFKIVMPELIKQLRPISSNDCQITFIKSFIDEINKLKEVEEEMHNKRLHWLKFWCNRALELYGEDAVIQFS